MSSYKVGDHLSICDICGFRYYASEMKMQWNGLFACPACFDTKSPLLTPATGLHEKQHVDINRPPRDSVFVNPSTRPGDVIL